MATQNQKTTTVDLPDEYTDEWGDAFMLRAYREASKHASRIAYDISDEMSGKKQPVHKKLLRDSGGMLSSIHLTPKGAFEAIQNGRTEAEVIEEITYGATGYPRREDPLRLLAEIVAKREGIDLMWARYEVSSRSEDEAGKAEAARLYTDADVATDELNELVLRAIADGKVPGRQAAAAALSQLLTVDRLERAEATTDGGQS